MITNAASGTNLHEIAPAIYRINTPVEIPGGMAFNFNQYLVADDEPLLFHTGPKRMFPLVAEAIGKVLPVERLRHVAFSHFEADECGSLNDFLAAAPAALAACSRVAAMVSVNDVATRPARPLADGEVLRTGQHAFKWLDAPHVPHGWDCGFMMELETRTLLCGDLFTQGGTGEVALAEADILGPSEAFRQAMDYYAHAPQTAATLERVARERPRVLACMHGSAWQGDGALLLRALASALGNRAAVAITEDNEPAR
jgi:flavorubredoxin